MHRAHALDYLLARTKRLAHALDRSRAVAARQAVAQREQLACLPT
jgi:predicted transcriptional regulator